MKETEHFLPVLKKEKTTTIPDSKRNYCKSLDHRISLCASSEFCGNMRKLELYHSHHRGRSLRLKTCERRKHPPKRLGLPHSEQSSLTCKTGLLSYYVHRSSGVNLGTWHKKEEGTASQASRVERLECSVCLKIGFIP